MKTKIVILVGIALCTMLLISPTIANSANSNILEIYGNANEDDTIDMRDLTYVKLIFFGKKPETELADAKYDGKINPLDFIQIKLIIVGKEKELTLIDSADRIVTVKKPVQRTVFFNTAIEMMRSLKLRIDKIVVGVSDYIVTKELYTTYYPELNKAKSVGTVHGSPNYEAILELQPEVVFISATSFKSKGDEIQNKLETLAPDIIVVRFDGFRQSTYVDEVRKMGYIFGKTKEADEFLDFYCGITNTIKERVEGIPENKKPKVYCERWRPYGTGGKGDVYDERIKAAGGINIAEFEGHKYVDPEWVAERNSDIILRGTLAGSGGVKIGGGYHVDDITEMKSIRNEIMSRPELAEVRAVKNGRVYIFCYIPFTGSNVLPLYMAKWFHPDLFEDFDPKAIHQGYLTKFQGLDYDLDKHGVFVYPEPS